MSVNVPGQQPIQTRDEDQIDLMRLVRMGQSHFRVAASVVVICVAVAVGVALTSPKLYSATATLKIDQQRQTVLTPGTGPDTGADPTSALLETEVGELQSMSLAKAVAAELHLDLNPEFNPLSKRRQPAVGTDINSVARTLLDHLKINHVGASYLITVQADSRDPLLSARIANAVAQQFITDQQQSRVDAVTAGGSNISQRLVELRQQVQDADTKLQQYKIANNLMSAQGATLTEQEISGLDQQLAQARAQEAEANARLSTARSQMAVGGAGADIGDTLNSPVIQGLRLRRAEISQNLADLQGRYGDAHPKLLKAQRELQDTDQQIQAEITRIVSNLTAQAEVARQRVASMQASVNQSRGVLAQNGRATVELDELQRNSDAAKSLYDTFLNKFKEANAAAGFQRSDAAIVDFARAPTGPSAPKRGLIVALGFLVGLSGALAYIFIAEQLFLGLNDIDSIEKNLKRPYLGSLPLLVSTLQDSDARSIAPVDYVVEKPLSSFSEALRSLAASVKFSDSQQEPKVIAITSSLPGEGKTTTSICLARICALGGQRVLVVDCDPRQKSISRTLNTNPAVGLVEVLSGQANLDEALMADGKTELLLLPIAKSQIPLARDFFATKAMADLIVELRARFDLIILDTGPIVLVTNTRDIARHADAVVLLAHWRKTSRRLVRSSIRLLEAASAPLAGVVLTMVDLRRTATVDPSDPSAYYRAYSEYYQDN